MAASGGAPHPDPWHYDKQRRITWSDPTSQNGTFPAFLADINGRQESTEIISEWGENIWIYGGQLVQILMAN